MSNKCAIWHSQPFVNPLTNRKIKIGGPTYKELERECGPPPMRSRRRRRSPSPSRRSVGSRRSIDSSQSFPATQLGRRSPGRSNRSSGRSQSPRELYCGNNARDDGLRDGSKILGTRYQCLRKGIGRGLNEPIFSYSQEYEPIEQIKVFCGNGNILPRDKDRFGTRDECLRKGFAVGQKQKCTRDGDIQRGPIVSQERGWYKVYLPFALGR
jgi:hypothetical protein